MSTSFQSEIKMQKQIDEVLETMPAFVNEWYADMRLNNKTSSSCYDYLVKIRNFLEYINSNPIDMNVNEITQIACESYCLSCETTINKDGMETYTSNSYRKGIHCSISCFLNFLVSKHYIEYNYMNSIKRRKNDAEKKDDTRFLTKDDFNKILKAAKKIDKDVMLSNRNVLIVLLFMTTGLKKTAISELNIDSIDIKNKRITVLDTKGNKTIFYFGKQVDKYLKLWLKDRECLKTDKSGNALFLRLNGDRLSDDTLYNVVKNCCEKSVGEKYPPHKLRASFCSILYDETHDIEMVKTVAGFSSVGDAKEIIKYYDKKRGAEKIISNIFDN